MRVLDIIESTDIDWMNKQIDDAAQFIAHFNDLVELEGYNRALYKIQKFINLSKSADWYYDMLSQKDDIIKSKYTRMINVRSKLEQLINTGLSYE